MEKREPSRTIHGNVNWYSHKTGWGFPKKLKIELPHDPAIPFLGIYPKKINSVTLSIVSPSICHEVMGPDSRILIFLNAEL